ncbi:testis-expressed protein 47-like [Belonocnema kinseyi]|uniref:testis-expressed protein 47-like n=1 Tax=Belonocnema kinseyi TaxID=2817044 RepID=UPI00143D9DD8|nr:testis-expressed protein 47-like [Belonocnema kinseyi]
MNEPVRKSYLDIVKRNLRAADRLTFCTRFIYFGEYYDTAEVFEKQMKNIINHLNHEHNDIPIYGLLLVYPKYFIHLVTSCEEMIFRHFKAIFLDKGSEVKLGKVLHLPVQHHIYRPYFTHWYSTITSPPVLLEKLENTELPEIEKHVRNIMLKIYKLCEFVIDANSKTGEPVSHILKDIEEKNPENLPESTVLEFLLNCNSPVLVDMRHYLKSYVEIPDINFYNDRVWPVPSKFMPTNMSFKPEKGKKKNDSED